MGLEAARRPDQVHVVLLGGGQASVISASRMTAASLPPNVEEDTVMPAKLYSGGASFISRCMVPVRFVGEEDVAESAAFGVERHDDDRFAAAFGGRAALRASETVAACSCLVQLVLGPGAVGRESKYFSGC